MESAAIHSRQPFPYQTSGQKGPDCPFRASPRLLESSPCRSLKVSRQVADVPPGSMLVCALRLCTHVVSWAHLWLGWVFFAASLKRDPCLSFPVPSFPLLLVAVPSLDPTPCICISWAWHEQKLYLCLFSLWRKIHFISLGWWDQEQIEWGRREVRWPLIVKLGLGF